MKQKKGYLIQIIPLGTGKGKSFTLRPWQMKMISVFLILLIGLMIAFSFHQTRVALKISGVNFLEQTNRTLKGENERYREALAILDRVIAEQERINQIGRILLAPPEEVPELQPETTPLSDENELEQHIARFERDSTFGEGARPSIKPVVGIITQEWREGEDPHRGVDIAAPLHDPVYASAPGVVTLTEKTGDLGLSIIIDHGEGYQTLYGHLGRILVKKGEEVQRGSPIGTIGMTGNTSGPHLHYEVLRDSLPVNPSFYFSE